MIRLDLTDDQAEILGYALTMAKRECHARAQRAMDEAAKSGATDRAARIEDLRVLLDTAPEDSQ